MNYGKSFLIKFFEEFYLIILKNKKRIEKGVFFGINDSDEEKQAKVSKLQSELYVFIKDKNSKIMYDGGKIAAGVFEEVSYIMAGLADEVFLSINWDGKKVWRRNLLEQKIFGTNHAGEKLLANLNDFLKEQNTQNNEVGIIYLYTLSLGFKGKFKGEEKCDHYIKLLKEKLHAAIYHESSNLFKSQKSLFAQAYSNTFKHPIEHLENPFKIWQKTFFGSAVLYIVLSSIVWSVNIKSSLVILNTAKKSGLI